jgi:proline iminopeptidase
VAAQEIVHVARRGFDLHYRVHGSGEPVAILAGGPGFDCDYMEPVALKLAKTHQAILVELRGTGRSIPPAINRETVNARETLADLDAVREQMNLESWTLAGHSFGAILAMAYAIRYPQRVASLVLMNSGPIRYASAAVEMET